MPGMGKGLTTNDPIIVSAFHTSLLHQGLIVLLILAVAGVTLNVLRSFNLRQVAGGSDGRPTPPLPDPSTEPLARRVLRISFGLIWVLDGLLQGQTLDAARHGPPGHPSDRCGFVNVGPAHGELRHHDLELPPGPSRGSDGVDSGRHRPVVAHRPSWHLVANRRAQPASAGDSWYGYSANPSEGYSPRG